MNKVILIGRTTKDIELKGDETKVANFTLAVIRNVNKEVTDFIPCVAFNHKAEILEKYVKKGNKVAIQGNIQISKYEKDGKTEYNTQVVVDEVFLQ
ncbi:MAG: single-stranded DNA-binding protein [Ruminococcaceae bacterium]|nr:single-stranded DNA-binding protein [Oscillospiraceae bacterium]